MKAYNIILLLFLTLLLPNQHSVAGTPDFIFSAFGTKAKPVTCQTILKQLGARQALLKENAWKSRVVEERAPKFLSDLEYLREQKYSNTLGLVDTRYLKEFDTRFFYTSTAKAAKDGSIPIVDPSAKALVIYFHSSGAVKSGGEGFAPKMNSLAKMGYSSVSFDLPFHQDGSRNPVLYDSKEFSDYIDKIVNSLKLPGQPVILVGHSMGPELIAEYITRHPQSVDSAILISPQGFDEVTKKWFIEKTSKMPFAIAEEIESGGERPGKKWEEKLRKSTIWNQPNAAGRVDPTLANPNLKVSVISGSMEEYIPGKLTTEGLPTNDPRDYDVTGVFKNFFNKAQVVIEPGAGHSIFNHKDASGQDVILRSILKANGESLLDEKSLRKITGQISEQNKTLIDKIALRYSKDLFFRSWLDSEAHKAGVTGQQMIAKFIEDYDKNAAQKIISTFTEIEKNRSEAIITNIKNTEKWAPTFYAENKDDIDILGTKKGVEVQPRIFMKYLNFLSTKTHDQIAGYAKATPDVYTVVDKVNKGESLRALGPKVQRAPEVSH